MPFLVRVRIFTFRTYRETARSVQGQDGRRKTWLARESQATSISGSYTIRKKWCVCLLYGSQCAPLLLPWLGEVQGASLSRTQASTDLFQHIYPCSGCLRAPTGAAGGAPDSTRRSTVGTLNMDICAGTGNALPWVIARDVPCTFPSHGSNSGARGGP